MLNRLSRQVSLLNLLNDIEIRGIVVEALDGFRTSVCSTEYFVTKLKEKLQRKPLVCENVP